MEEQHTAAAEVVTEQKHHAIDVFSTSNLKLYAIVTVMFAAITLVMFWPITLNIAGTTFLSGDVYQSMWNLWWVPYAVFTLHQSPYFTSLLHYPVGANLVTQDLMPLAGIFSAPLQAISLAFAYNVVFLLGFILSGLFMFILALYLVPNKYAAFIAGLVFAFSPMHISQSYVHLNWTTIEWIPLFILFFLLLIKEKKPVYAAGTAVSFLLITFMGDLQQGMMTIVFVVVLLLFTLITRRQEILNKKFLTALAETVAIVAIIGSPLFIPIIQSLASSGVSGEGASAISQNMQWSNDLLSFFLPSSYNFFFNGIANSYYNLVFAPDIGEKVAYVGYSVLFLATFGLYNEYKKNRLSNNMVWMWVTVIVIFAWMSIGPTLTIGSASTSIPGIYYAYTFIPLFNVLREPGRFDLFVTVGLAILSALGMEYLLGRYAAQHKKPSRMALYITVLFTFLIFVEYNGMPNGSILSSSYVSTAIPQGFSQLATVSGNYTVMPLPDLPSPPGPGFIQGQAMYYQTAFHRPILGGYTSRTNDSQTLAAEAIPLSLEASTLEAGQGLSFPSPLDVSSTNATLLLLATYRVGFISVLKQAYTAQEQSELLGYLDSTFGQPTYQDNATAIFSTQQALQQNAGKSMSAYTIGLWLPGYDFCASSANCNASFATAWWGGNERGIIVYSPRNTTVRMSMSAMSYIPYGLMDIYLNQAPLASVNLTSSPMGYTFNVPLQHGYNELVLYTQNSTQTGPYLSFGVSNVTFS